MGWGENLALGSETGQWTTDRLTTYIQEWYDEVVDANWTAGGVVPNVYSDSSQCVSTSAGSCEIAHYLQLVWATR